MSEEQRKYWVIRVSQDAKFVLVVYSVDGKLPPPWGESVHTKEDLTFQRCTYSTFPDFCECTFDAAIQAFSGVADGMGRGERPAYPFNSMEEVMEWRTRAVLQVRIANNEESAALYDSEEPTVAQEFRTFAEQARQELAALDVTT